MSWKTTLVLALLFAALGGFYYWDIVTQKEKEKQEDLQNRLFTIAEENVAFITIKNTDATFEFEKRGDGWYLVKPIQDKADFTATDVLLTNIDSIRRDRVVQEDPQNPSAFGLDPPEIVVTAYSKDKSSQNTVHLGHKNPTGAFVYFQLEGEKAISTCDNVLLSAVDKKLFDFRDKSIINFETEDVQEFKITVGKDSITIARGESGWQITDPMKARGDKSAIEKFLNQIRDANASEFASEKADDLTTYSLAEPYYMLKLKIGADKAVKTLHIGSLNPSESGYYCKRAEADTIMVMPKNVMKEFKAEVEKFRDKTMVALDRKSVDHYRLTRNDKTIVLHKEEKQIGETTEEQWIIDAPQQLKGDNSTCSSLLYTLERIKAEGFIDNPEADAVYGFDEPFATLTLHDKDGNHTVVIGKETEDKKQIYVKSSDFNIVFLMSSRELGDFDKTLFDFRDKLIMSYERKELEKIQVKTLEETFTFTKESEKWWKREEDGADIPTTDMDKIAWALDYIRMNKIVNEDGANLATYGLVKPRMEVTVWKLNNQNLGTLLIGQEDSEANAIYAKLSDKPMVFQVDKYVYNDIEEGLKNLKEGGE